MGASNSSLNGMKLFCLPYAGGSATVYKKWTRELNEKIELIPVELAGRGKRFTEPFYSSLHDGVIDISTLIMNQIGENGYSLFGHSMGSLYICEFMKHVQANGWEKPKHLFLSGMRPPHIDDRKKIHHLPDDEFWEEVIRLGGTPKQVSENKELMGVFTPVLRSDYKNVENYVMEELNVKWDMDITILVGDEDEMTSRSEIARWNDYTNQSCSIVTFQGGHFFINEEEKKVIDLINRTLIA